MRAIYVIITFCLLISGSCAQSEYHIQGRIEGLQRGVVFLYEYEGSRQVLIDSFKVENGTVHLKFPKDKKNGMYHLRWGKEPQHGFDFIFNYESFQFSCHVDSIETLKFHGSIENEFFYLFYPVLQTIDIYTQLGDYLNKTDPIANKPKLVQLNKRIDSLEFHVQYMLDKMKESYQNLLSYKIIRSLAIPVYDYEYQQGRTPKMDAYIYTSQNYFKYVFFDESAMTRTPVLQKLLQDYFTLYVLEPNEKHYRDACDMILQRALVNEEVFLYILNLLMNTFEQSDFPEIFVYLYETFYSERVSDVDGRKMTYELIKKSMPGSRLTDFNAMTIDGIEFRMSQVEVKNIALLFIWDPHCGHCKEFIRDLNPIFNQYKNKGFQIIAFAIIDDEHHWKEAVQKYGIDQWLNVSDLQGMLSPLFDKIHIRGTPEMYIIDNQLNILARPVLVEEVKDILNTSIHQ